MGSRKNKFSNRMSLLTKKEYLALNDKNVTFRKYSPAEKNARYQRYLAGKRTRNLSGGSVLSPVPTNVSSTSSQNNKNKNNKIKRRQQLPAISKVSISDCTLLYAQASIDPFSKISAMPCIPDNICVPSYKFCCKSEGSMSVNLQGIGFIGYNPWTMITYDITNDATHINQPIFFTQPTDNSTSFYADIGNVTAAVIGCANSNSPLSTAQFTANDESVYRLVAAGLEIEYTGQILNQSGAITILQNDGLKDVPNTTVTSIIQNNPRARTCGNSKDNRCYISYSPTDAKFLGYKNLNDYLPANINGGASPHYSPLIVYVSGATPGITFHYKAIAYFECQLPNADVSPSESDPIGYPAFLSAKSMTPPTDNPGVDLKNTLVQTIKNVAKSVSGFGGDIGMGLGADRKSVV